MHAAAEKKGISQPALTKSLRLLEADLKAELFVRSHKGLEPTDEGRALYRHARAIDQEARFAALDIGEMHETMGGQISIGVGPVLAMSTFPAVLAEFHRQLPRVEILVETGIADHLVDGLMHERFDVVVAARPETLLPERFVTVPLFTTDMVVICRRGHPLGGRKAITRADLTAYRRVGFVDDREFEKRSRRLFGRRSDRLRPVLQTTSLTIMFGVLATTDYYAIVSSIIVQRARREGLADYRLAGGLWELDIELMCKGSLASSKPIGLLRRLLSAHPA